MIIMPTDQLKLSSDQLSWSAGARCGNNKQSLVIIIYNLEIDNIGKGLTKLPNIFSGMRVRWVG